MRLARHHARLLVIAVCACVAGGIATAGGAENSNLFQQRADALRNENDTLATRLHGAVLGLYSLDAEVDRAQSRLAALQSRHNDIALRQRAIRMRLDTARQDLRISQRRLAVLVHTMYEQDATDPLAVILGAESLEDALATLDDLARSATQHSQVAAQSRTARDALESITSRLARESAKIRAARGRRSANGSIPSKRRRPNAVVTSRTLAAERNLNETQIGRLDSRAQASVERSLAVTAAASAPTPSTGADADRSRRRTVTRNGAHDDRRRDRLRSIRRDRHRPLDGVGNRRRGSVRHPTRDANDHPGLRPGASPRTPAGA